MEIFSRIKNQLSDDNEELMNEINWCSEIISSNRLYDPILEHFFKEFPDKQNEVKYK